MVSHIEDRVVRTGDIVRRGGFEWLDLTILKKLSARRGAEECEGTRRTLRLVAPVERVGHSSRMR